MPDYRSVYATFKDSEQAIEIARALVEEKMVACVNVIERVRSVYHWQGQVHDDSEAAFFAKTRADKTELVIARIAALHTYETPCIVVLPVEAGHQPYLAWIDESLDS